MLFPETPITYFMIFKNTIQKERRTFLKKLGAGSLAALSIPVLANSGKVNAMPAATSILPDEKYWEQIKKQFSVPSNLIMLNAANLCPPPVAVSGEVQGFINGLEKDVSFQYRSQFTDKRKKAVEALAQFTGVANDEIGITRNTSESNNIIVNGLDLKAGDEIIFGTRIILPMELHGKIVLKDMDLPLKK